ncbi:histidine kinase [Cupriavidus sp. USMAA2-4]|uniref:histidine kinase n=1 Tax=Cupriavidus malaysiensis TaxID=367825 RepID=A0A1D9I3Z6_9BURK|nr:MULTISPECIES: histidine kinase [Cupriavidus]AOY93634.1 histidine kinase [Cupriavidus sp. USMAA2-4]AOZ00088.1 histidine kinase [Cupriavidus sp. USMAHM13]AOZ06832.1 histidine kinase [Cupriavidus malaysiensis]
MKPCLALAVPSRFSILMRDLAFVLCMNTVIAVSLNYGFQTGGSLWHNFVYSQLIGLSIWVLIDIPRVFLWWNDKPRRLPFLLLAAAAVPLGVIIGGWCSRVSLGLPPKTPGEISEMMRVSLVVGMLASASMIYFYWSREKLAYLERHAALDALQREEAEKQLVRAQLMALQAQIEPHFLFNSLANLDGLIATDPHAARRLLQRLIGFLRTSLAHTRAEQCTLSQEFELLRSYLDIQGMRFGARLSYELDLPAELAEVEIPPMLIQPLVENAVTHGIEPCMMGGRIVLSARAAGDGAVQVSIADTGVGFAHGGGKGSGLGLTHVRERLARIFGAGASMQIEENSPRGVIVRLTLPIGQGARDSGQRAASGAGEAGPALAGRPATASLGAAARS